MNFHILPGIDLIEIIPGIPVRSQYAGIPGKYAARTIADLESSEHITVPHILEALQYRERKG